jgi:xanthine dehydrogenase accessory factor
VGGGHLEFDAMDHARLLLKGEAGEPLVRYALGPSLGQCCGGEVVLQFEKVDAANVARLAQQLAGVRAPVALFGGGHVGRALVQVLLKLPMDVTWIDSRDEIFPPDLARLVRCEHSAPVHAAVAGLAPQSRVLIMSFSHAEDLDVVAACLARQHERADLPYIGLIGSKTKWASFRQRLLARGFTELELTHVTCPIGVSGIADKRPEVIAVAVAAQILQVPV